MMVATKTVITGLLGLFAKHACALQLSVSSANALIDSSSHDSLLLLLETQRGWPKSFPALAAILRSDKGTTTQRAHTRSMASWEEKDFMLLLKWVLYHFKPCDIERELFFPESAIVRITDTTMRTRISLSLLREGLSGGLQLLKGLATKNDDFIDNETLRTILRPEFADQVDYYGRSLFRRTDPPLPQDIDWALFAGANLFRAFTANWAAPMTKTMIPLLVQAPLPSLARLAIRERINNEGLYEYYDELGWIQWTSLTCARLALDVQKDPVVSAPSPTWRHPEDHQWVLLVRQLLLCPQPRSGQPMPAVTTLELFKGLLSSQVSNRDVLTLLEMASIMLPSLDPLLDSLQTLSERTFTDVGVLELERLASTLFYRHPPHTCQQVMRPLGQDFFKLLMYDPLVHLVMHQDRLKHMPFEWKLRRYRRWGFPPHVPVPVGGRTESSSPLMICDHIGLDHFQPQLNLPCSLTLTRYYEILQSLISESAPMIIYDSDASTVRPRLGYTESVKVTVQIVNALILGMVRFSASSIHLEPVFCTLLERGTKLPTNPGQNPLLAIDFALVSSLVNNGSEEEMGRGRREKGDIASPTWYMRRVQTHLEQLRGAIKVTWGEWGLTKYFPEGDICAFIQARPLDR